MNSFDKGATHRLVCPGIDLDRTCRDFHPENRGLGVGKLLLLPAARRSTSDKSCAYLSPSPSPSPSSSSSSPSSSAVCEIFDEGVTQPQYVVSLVVS